MADDRTASGTSGDDAGAKALMAQHAPPTWQTDPGHSQIARVLESNERQPMVVLSADIRRSTFLMKEAVDLGKHAEILGGFVDVCPDITHAAGAWFDKFMGDGFLAYWILDREAEDCTEELLKASGQAWRLCRALLEGFDGFVVDDFRRNSANFPSGVGLSIGIDAGFCQLVTVAGDLTILGPPVVGAVRMGAVSKPWEVVSNVYLGELLLRSPQHCSEADLKVEREYRETKEFEQEVYPVLLKGLTLTNRRRSADG